MAGRRRGAKPSARGRQKTRGLEPQVTNSPESYAAFLGDSVHEPLYGHETTGEPRPPSSSSNYQMMSPPPPNPLPPHHAINRTTSAAAPLNHQRLPTHSGRRVIGSGTHVESDHDADYDADHDADDGVNIETDTGDDGSGIHHQADQSEQIMVDMSVNADMAMPLDAYGQFTEDNSDYQRRMSQLGYDSNGQPNSSIVTSAIGGAGAHAMQTSMPMSFSHHDSASHAAPSFYMAPGHTSHQGSYPTWQTDATVVQDAYLMAAAAAGHGHGHVALNESGQGAMYTSDGGAVDVYLHGGAATVHSMPFLSNSSVISLQQAQFQHHIQQRQQQHHQQQQQQQQQNQQHQQQQHQPQQQQQPTSSSGSHSRAPSTQLTPSPINTQSIIVSPHLGLVASPIGSPLEGSDHPSESLNSGTGVSSSARRNSKRPRRSQPFSPTQQKPPTSHANTSDNPSSSSTTATVAQKPPDFRLAGSPPGTGTIIGPAPVPGSPTAQPSVTGGTYMMGSIPTGAASTRPSKLRSAARTSKNRQARPAESMEERRSRNSHNLVEKQYRQRLNESFESLLSSLPDPGGSLTGGSGVVGSAGAGAGLSISRFTTMNEGDGDGPSQPDFIDRRVTKAEVLDRARQHILDLERDRETLEREKNELQERADRLTALLSRTTGIPVTAATYGSGYLGDEEEDDDGGGGERRRGVGDGPNSRGSLM